MSFLSENSVPNGELNPLRPDELDGGCPLQAGMSGQDGLRADAECAVTSLLQRGCEGAVF